MVIIHDARLPEAALRNLRKYGDCISFITSGITSEAISGHPDIFFFPCENKLIVAPNVPAHYLEKLLNHHIHFQIGQSPVAADTENAASYNAVITPRFLIHHQNRTDTIILQQIENRQLIHVNQAFTRCSLLPLPDESFITSDGGIAKVLASFAISFLQVTPTDILLPPYRNGFIGGCMGVHENMVFVIGSLNHYTDGQIVRAYLEDKGYQIIELYDGPLWDGGSLFFLQ